MPDHYRIKWKPTETPGKTWVIFQVRERGDTEAILGRYPTKEQAQDALKSIRKYIGNVKH